MHPDTKYVLVKGEKSWADEFEVEFFGLFHTAEWEYYLQTVGDYFEKLEKAHVKKHEWDRLEVDVYFGTNEALSFRWKDDWLSCFHVVNIAEDEYDLMLRTFGRRYGTGASAVFDSLLGMASDQEDAEEVDSSSDLIE